MRILSLPRQMLTRLIRSRTHHPTRWRIAFLGLLAFVLVMASLKYAAKVARPDETGQQSRSAFLRWRTMVRDVFTGTNIYVGKNEYPNPPVMTLVLRPFAELPPVPGAMAWFYTKVILTIFAAVWVFRLVSGTQHAIPDGAKAAAILLTLPAITGDLTHNNVNIFILFLVAACLELYRRGRDSASGVVLGLAIACKVTPLLFLAYFVWKRAWLVVVGCGFGLVLWLTVVPAAVFGWDRNTELLTDWYKLMVERPVLKGEITTEHPNQSLVGWVYRLGTHSPSFIEYEQTPAGDIPKPAAYHNLFDMGRPAAWVVVKLLTLAFAVGVVLMCRAPREERSGWRFATECGFIILGMLLLSERTWKHHAVVLLLPAAALAFVCTLDVPTRLRRLIIGTLLAAACLMALPGLFGTRAGDLALVYGTHTAAFLLLTVGSCAVLVCGLKQSGSANPANGGQIPA